MSIHTFAEKIKGWAGEKQSLLATMGTVVGVSVLSFWLGFSAQNARATVEPVIIQCPVEAYMPQKTTLSSGQGVEKPAVTTPESGAFVASKNGTKYYPIGCSGANRIKDENKVFFTSSKQAESAGYTRTATCK